MPIHRSAQLHPRSRQIALLVGADWPCDALPGLGEAALCRLSADRTAEADDKGQQHGQHLSFAVKQHVPRPLP